MIWCLLLNLRCKPHFIKVSTSAAESLYMQPDKLTRFILIIEGLRSLGVVL